MNHMLNITKKELREMLTPGSVASILVVMVMMMAIGTLIGGEVESSTDPTPMGLLDADTSNTYDADTYGYLLEFYEKGYNLTPEEAKKYVILMESPYGDNDAIIEEMNRYGLKSAVILDPDYSNNINNGLAGKVHEYYIFNNEGLLNSTTSSINDVALDYVNSCLSIKLLGDETLTFEPSFYLNPIKYNSNFTYINGELCEGITPMQISSSLMGQNMMIPIIIMIIIMMIGSIVISSMGNEKENKTLETLLTLPVKRTTIVTGKLVASAIVGLAYGLAYMVGMYVYMSSITLTVEGVDLSQYGLSLGIADWAIIMVMIFLTIMCALGMCMILGAFVKNYKAAQTMTLPISVLAMIPMFITMFSSWSSLPGTMQGVLFAIPFTHPMMVMDNLMFGNFTVVIAGMVYLAIFAIATILITVRIYNSDILLTGLGQTKIAQIFKNKKKKKDDHDNIN